ncbi:MAG: C25 family cysteine peptidase [Cyclobacteriaceae bacterium]
MIWRGLMLSISLVGVSMPALSQVGNEWIQFNQFYYKIPVAQAGLYRITYADLQNAGFPVGSVDPRRLQLFHRGEEQAIYVEGETDAVFNPTDYIEFYGLKNDGTPDTELYKPASYQPHPYHNLFNDTTWYFLTYNLLQAGKRMPVTWEVNVTGIPKETSHAHTNLLVLSNQYATGIGHGSAPNNFIQNTFFDLGEGWTGTLLRQNEQADYVLSNLANPVQADGTPVLEVQVVSRADVLNRVEIYAGPTTAGLRLLTSHNFSGFTPVALTLPINWTDIGADGNMTVRVRALSQGAGAARLSASFIRVTMPQSFNAIGANEKLFILHENPSDKSFVEIQNPLSGSRLFDVTDPANVVWYNPPTPASPLHPVISGTSVSRKLFLTSVVRSVTGIKRVVFRQFNPAEHDYIIISHPLLRQPSGGYADPVAAYGGYRASADGGSYDTLVVNIDQLYDQFGYGETTPLAIYRFMKFFTATHLPKYLFIIGKGLDPSWNYFRNPNAPEFSVHKNLVPSAGMPASDMYFTIGLAGSTYEPAVPTGRISATSAAQVAAYLNKVKEMEAQPFDALWRKHLLHLSGGIAPGETDLFRLFLEQFGTIAEGPYLGGSVKAQAKNTTEVGELINIAGEVNSGTNLITFFGHSSPTTNDFEVGFVTDPLLGYNNPGRYPMFLINGCNSADFFTTTLRWGEDWVLAANRGALSFMAHTSFGYVATLRKYSETFYQVAYGDSTFIQKGIGDIQKEIARRYMLTSAPTEINLTQVSQMLLLGDPAVKVFGASKPDYEVNSNTLAVESLDGEPVTALTNEFSLRLIIRNFGQAVLQPVAVRVTRIFNDNSTESYDTLYQPVFYSDTLTFIIRQQKNKGFGNNVFQVEVDPFNQIDELNEANNVAEISYFIPLNITRNLFPYDFAIVNTATTTLTVSSTDILGTARTFLLEVDTLNTFNSAFLKQFEINGVIAEKSLDLLPQDSLVYYWRTRFKDPQPGESTDWATSSFSYIAGSPEGWAQLHFPQYLKNSSVGLVKDAELRLLEFEESTITVDIHTFGSNHPASHTEVSVKINGSEYNPSTFVAVCRDNTINLIAFDRNSTIPYAALELNPFIGLSCGRRPQVINSFRPAELITGMGNDIFQYMANVSDGDSVVVFSIGDAGYASWPAAAKLQFELIGISSAQINSLQPGEPVVFFGKKGSLPGTARMYRPAASPANEQELLVSGTISGGFSSGTMTTPRIGPATAWHSLKAEAVFSEFPVTDFYRFSIYGVNLQGQTDLLLADAGSSADLSSIDAEQYPYLQVEYYAEDATNLTPPQLLKWLIVYTPVAEGVLTYSGEVGSVELDEGEVWTGTYGFRNISQKNFTDSLTVRMETFNQQVLSNEVHTVKIKAPAPGETTPFTFAVNTLQKSGLNDVKVYVNPRVIPEQYYENNVLELYDFLQVKADLYNPVLDVTVDGRYLQHGDYVSPNPKIRIILWDENSLIKKTDTLGVKIFLTYPDEATPTPVYFSRTDVTWFAQTDAEKFRVEFSPVNLPEGQYTLLVEARDARNNSSGAVPYAITFIVRYEQTALLLAPHPNPMSSSIAFVVVLTGETPPDKLLLDIINTNGKPVHTLEFGAFVIGTNRLVWDGTDSRGNLLANGLYLYRLRLFRNAELIPLAIPEGERFMKNGYGKLVIAR